jgi:hypothetical protein
MAFFKVMIPWLYKALPSMGNFISSNEWQLFLEIFNYCDKERVIINFCSWTTSADVLNQIKERKKSVLRRQEYEIHNRELQLGSGVDMNCTISLWTIVPTLEG